MTETNEAIRQKFNSVEEALNWTIDPQNLKDPSAAKPQATELKSGAQAQATSPEKNLTEQTGAQAQATSSKGTKYDHGKEPLTLLSRVWLLGVARVLDFGSKKYSSHNWRGGIERSRLISAALRHLLSYNEGEDADPETGLSHLDHASCCLMFARELHETRPDLDDRYKGGSK